MQNFSHLVSVTFQGVVLVFGRPVLDAAGIAKTDIWFNVLGQNTDANDTVLDWAGFTKLDMTRQVREVGMSLITLDRDSHTVTPSDTPFRVVTDQKYISIIQQSARGTLIVNRYRLLSAQSGSNQKVTTYTLSPVWEVRFARSHNEDVPADKSDKPDYRDPDGKPFLEPTLELAMIDRVEDGAFDVALLPISGKDSFAWQFIVRDKAANDLRLFRFPANEAGLFDLTGKAVGDDHHILPDSRFSLKREGAADTLPLTAAPRLTTYMKHEKVMQPDGSSLGVKRATRVMIVQTVTENGKTLSATLDCAVGADGRMARLSGPVSATALTPAPFDLSFDGLSELRLAAPQGSPDPRGLNGPYQIEALFAPAQKGDGTWLIGGDPTASAETAAPFLRIVEGDKLECGFGTGTVAVRATTLHQVLQPGVWSQVVLAYRGPGDAPFALTVNGSAVPLTPCSAPANPSGAVLDRIGGASSGFKGALKSLRLLSAGTEILRLPCESVDYSTTPPVTPNLAASGITVTVQGAKLEPSTSPVDSPMSGAFHIDAGGLTFYAGLADFIAPASDFCLLEGSDGLLHLYYQAADNALSVAQFAVDAARAGFAGGWSTDWAVAASVQANDTADQPLILLHHGQPCAAWTPVAPRLLAADKAQSGFVDFVAHRVGTYMNATAITIRPSDVSPLLCDVEVKGPGDVGTELWSGLPRDIAQFQRIWNGAASDNPDDRDVISRARPYYDYSGRAPAVAAASGAGTDGAFFLFTSVPRLPLPLSALTVASGSRADRVTLTVETANPPRWPATEVLRQVWPDVPADAQSVIDALSGKASRYDYAAVTTPGSRAYGVRISIARSDDQIGHVVIFVRNALKTFTLRISDGSSLATCKVEVCDQLLQEVPREQAAFIRVLNGDDPHYAYPAGYLDGLATQIYALGNGLSADVTNTIAPVPGGALAYAGMVRVLYQGSGFDRAVIAPQARTLATVFQKAVLRFDGQDSVLRGSLMFGAVTEAMPSNGGIGRLADTRTASNGVAALRVPGVNGGWMPVTPRFSLGMTAGKTANFVQVSVDKALPQTEAMAIPGDLTVQGWLRQDEARAAANERLLTYNVTGCKDDPDMPIRLMLGAKQGPALNLVKTTFVSRSFNFDPPALTLQLYLRLPDPVVTGTILTVSEVNGGTEYLSLTLDAFGKVTLTFLSGAGKLTLPTALTPGLWGCVTATVADAGSGKVTLGLALNDKAPVTVEATNSFTGKLGALTLGSRTGQGIVAAVNGLAFWQRALSAADVANSWRYGFPDTDPMLGIRWNLAEGGGSLAANSAASGAEYDAPITNLASPGWDKDGAFKVPYAGRNDLVIASNRILKGWTNVALASRQGRALKFDGQNSGKVKEAEAFKPSGTFAVEVWVSPKVLNQKQIIAEKPGSWSLYINTLGQACLKVELQRDGANYDDPPIRFSHEVKIPVVLGQTCYVVANFTTGANADSKGTDQYAQQSYFINAAISVNGAAPITNNKADFTRQPQVRTETSEFMVAKAASGTFQYRGLLSHLRVWSRNLTPDDIARTTALRLTPVNQDGLVAGWDFEETSGTSAADLTGNHPLDLTSNQLWCIWQDVAQAQIVVNGRTSLPLPVSAADMGGYGDLQMSFGASLATTAPSLPLHGDIDDIRLFNTRLTEQQLRESMNKPLSGGEDHLAAYWRIDAGSGPVVYDMTGRGNNGRLKPDTTPPVWKPSSAPLQNEGQYVVNALGGVPDYYVAHIAGAPAVAEYAAAEKDAYGRIYSVMKRGYFYRADTGETELRTGYKVGDLDTIFVGQVQSKPTIVGYIEGGPPLPSENQTLAYWVGDGGGPARAYAGISTALYQETETKTWSFSASRSSTFNGSFNVKGGPLWKGKAETSVGLGAEAQVQVVEYEVKLGAKLTLSGDIGSTDQVAQSHSNAVSLSTSMTPSGTWEAEDAILNPAVGRRYIQNNVGIALVKSATADLYMLALKGTQTPVGYVMMPNTQIPVDTNIIDFPINPRYVKNGTLDGKVGLVNDPDYPGADLERGSYFKPVEAYAIKTRIRQQEQALKAWYDQFDADKYRLLAKYQDAKDRLAESPGFNFGENRNLRSMFNNYVWTAAGGLHREEWSTANTYTETYTGASSLKFAAGAEFAAKVTSPATGFYIEADAMLGNTWTATATKAANTQNGFRLTCNVIPTDFLAAPILTRDATGKLQFGGYQRDAAPGKVDAYRYMSFLIAPEQANFDALSQVVEPNWLNNSTTAAAAAMREAMANPAQPWRVLYRTTYVSRVPAPFQPVKDDTDAPNITPPANPDSNSWLTRVLDQVIGKPDPTRLEIGSAIDTLLGSRDSGAGILVSLVPWWTDFYAAAQTYGSAEFRELADLRANLLSYMASKYEAQAYAGH